MEHFDVVIIGAGLSGIGAGCRLQTRCREKRYVILEARSEIGGTWDLFRYPGVRSDSDMFTLGFSFRPWKEARAIADGPSILKYVRETAREFGVDRHIRFRQRVESAAWSSEEGQWRVEARTAVGERVEYGCSFLYGCTGYYRYDAGYEPEFPGAERFRGQMVHPQRWPEDLDYSGKKVVIIGSGATAVTLVPAMAGTAKHVTMLQRSPTYILSLPDHDAVAQLMRQWLPVRAALRAVRWKNILISMWLYQMSRHAPERARKMFRQDAVRNLPEGYEVDKHFNPRYQPWDQRVCLLPDSDLFKAIASGQASVVTDTISTFTERGIRLESGRELEADLIVTATGLQMLALGAVQLTVDETTVTPGNAFIYKGTMLSNVPNFAFCIGYTNASWTLRADLASTFVCRVLNYMDRHGYSNCVPVCDAEGMEARPLLPLKSGYVQRAAAGLPKQAAKKPWMIQQNYILDMMMMKLGRIDDGVLRFSAERRVRRREEATEEATSSSAADD